MRARMAACARLSKILNSLVQKFGLNEDGKPFAFRLMAYRDGDHGVPSSGFDLPPMTDHPTGLPSQGAPDVTALRKPVFPDELATGVAGAARAGIALAAGSLAAFDQQVLRTMLQTLATRLSAYFRISEAREAELTLVEHPGDPASFLLRVRNASSHTELKLPRPLRLMPLADALNASIDIVRPHARERAFRTRDAGAVARRACMGHRRVPPRAR